MRIFKRKGLAKWWADWTDQKGQRHRRSTGGDDKKLAEALEAKWQRERFMEQHFGVIADPPLCEAFLRAILNKAHREGSLSVVPPFPKVKPSKGRCRWLTGDEEAKLLEAAKPHLRALIAFAVDMGGRRSELFKLDWRNVDLARGAVTFTKTKNGEDRSVRLTNWAKQVLMDLGPQKSGPVFTYRGKPIKDVKTAFETVGLEDFRFHDLRHTFASRLVQKGISIYEVMHLTGHKSLVMVQCYAHLAPDYQNRAIEALNELRRNFGTVDQKGCEEDTAQKEQNPSVSARVLMVEPDGIEPTTSTMPL